MDRIAKITITMAVRIVAKEVAAMAATSKVATNKVAIRSVKVDLAMLSTKSLGETVIRRFAARNKKIQSPECSANVAGEWDKLIMRDGYNGEEQMHGRA
jgi:hypothetical protein